MLVPGESQKLRGLTSTLLLGRLARPDMTASINGLARGFSLAFLWLLMPLIPLIPRSSRGPRVEAAPVVGGVQRLA